MTSRIETPHLPIFRIYGPRLKTVKVAFLTTGAGVGFELFEFIDPPHVPRARHQQPITDSSDFPYTQAGFFHFCVTAPDPEEVLKRAVELGGCQVGETVSVGKEEREKALYLSDPWGNVVEVLSCSFEGLMANTE